MKHGILILLLALPMCLASAASLPQDKVRDFASSMVRQHGFDETKLLRLLSGVRRNSNVLEAISRPAEREKAWHEYRPIFVQEPRIRDGVRFWQRHRAVLRRAEREYGVNAAIIVSIIGVETFYGRITGRYRVLDSLATLAFAYPPRADFFRSELEQFLLLTREQGLNPLQLKGSYAGAMGLPQFISSSYRRYAVDFDGDGHVDIWNNPSDAIGSVANYFRQHDWTPGAAVAHPARAADQRYVALLNDDLGAYLSYGDLRARGVSSALPLDDSVQARLMRFTGKEGVELWLGLRNFYVITRYNHSSMYAMAVWQLAEQIRRRYAGDVP